MNKKEKTIDRLLGAISPEEKAGQLLVFGLTGAFIDPQTEDFVVKYNIGGLRTSPFFRKFIRYLPKDSPAIKNVTRPLMLQEKMWDDEMRAPHMKASEYASILNDLRQKAMERKHGIPLHFVTDYESGANGNYMPPGLISLPEPMGMSRIEDTHLLSQVWSAVGKQLKAIGLDWLHSPLVDVNTNPDNPEINTRSFGSDPNTVTNCARAVLSGLKAANMIGTLKHYPGRGAAADNAHYGISTINLDRQTMDRIHLFPYTTLCQEQIVPAIMSAHSIYPCLDSEREIATVSKPTLTGILREEIGFDGVITTDSMTMGGLMARYTLAEAVVRAIEAGVDIVLLKDENKLRYEVFDALVESIKTKRLSEDRVAASLRRIWSLKWDYGLFENGGIVKTDGLDEHLYQDDFHQPSAEAAAKVIHLLRDNNKILPLKAEQNILIIDRVLPNHLWWNDSWTHPGMFWEFMLHHSHNVSYTDYQLDTTERATEVIENIAPQVDVLVVTASFSQKKDMKPFIGDLNRFGKPIVLVTDNPYKLIIPDNIDTVVVNYSLMREGMKAVSDFLYGVKGKF